MALIQLFYLLIYLFFLKSISVAPSIETFFYRFLSFRLKLSLFGRTKWWNKADQLCVMIYEFKLVMILRWSFLSQISRWCLTRRGYFKVITRDVSEIKQIGEGKKSRFLILRLWWNFTVFNEFRKNDYMARTKKWYKKCIKFLQNKYKKLVFTKIGHCVPPHEKVPLGRWCLEFFVCKQRVSL